MLPMTTTLKRKFRKTEQDLLSLFSLSSQSSEASSATQSKAYENIVFSQNHSYPSFFFVNVVLLHISGHSKVRHFARFPFSNQHITSWKISMDNLQQSEDVSFRKHSLTNWETADMGWRGILGNAESRSQ